jgi:RNA polymerase sigma-70 factor (ECF subfamily)
VLDEMGEMLDEMGEMLEEIGELPVEANRLAAALADAQPSLRRLAQRLCGGSAADANDLLQDTFERAVRRGIPVGVRNPRAYLAVIMHHLFIDRCRVATRQPIPTTYDSSHCDVIQLEPAADDPAWTQITEGDILDALQRVEPVYRDVYRMHTFEHLSHAEIAQQLSIPRLTVATRLHRARGRLRQVLVKRFGLEGAL